MLLAFVTLPQISTHLHKCPGLSTSETIWLSWWFRKLSLWDKLKVELRLAFILQADYLVARDSVRIVSTLPCQLHTGRVLRLKCCALWREVWSCVCRKEKMTPNCPGRIYFSTKGSKEKRTYKVVAQWSLPRKETKTTFRRYFWTRLIQWRSVDCLHGMSYLYWSKCCQ